jgi:hypothetical protein
MAVDVKENGGIVSQTCSLRNKKTRRLSVLQPHSEATLNSGRHLRNFFDAFHQPTLRFYYFCISMSCWQSP